MAGGCPHPRPLSRRARRVGRPSPLGRRVGDEGLELPSTPNPGPYDEGRVPSPPIPLLQSEGQSPHPRPFARRARGDIPRPLPYALRARGGRPARGEGKSGLFLLFLTLCLVILSLSANTTSYAQSPIQVGLVVQLAAGSVETRCVTLNQSNPTGWDVLVAANIGVVGSPSGMGMAVCAIANVGCPADDCWCKFNSGENLYWSYWHFDGSKWNYSNLGASNYPVTHGAVEGWVWGDGRATPPVYTFEQICAPPPTATYTATSTPSPTLTYTAGPPTSTYTARPPTATSNLVPTASPIPFTPTVRSITQLPLSTTTLTPSPTITLPFGMAVAATTVAPAQTLPQLQVSPAAQVALDLQSISLTATAVEVIRKSEGVEESDRQKEIPGLRNFGLASLDLAYGFFFILVGGLLILLVILIRRRRAL